MKNTINNILIELTDITGFNHSGESLDAFSRAEEKIRQHIKKTIKDYIRVVDEHFSNNISPEIWYQDGVFDTLKMLENKYKEEYEDNNIKR